MPVVNRCHVEGVSSPPVSLDKILNAVPQLKEKGRGVRRCKKTRSRRPDERAATVRVPGEPGDTAEKAGESSRHAEEESALHEAQEGNRSWRRRPSGVTRPPATADIKGLRRGVTLVEMVQGGQSSSV